MLITMNRLNWNDIRVKKKEEKHQNDQKYSQKGHYCWQFQNRDKSEYLF